MKRLFLLSLFLSACTAQAQSPKSPNPISTVMLSPQVSPAASSRATRFTLKLTLTDKEDLKVREGDIVVKDQVLMDRVRV